MSPAQYGGFLKKSASPLLRGQHAAVHRRGGLIVGIRKKCRQFRPSGPPSPITITGGISNELPDTSISLGDAGHRRRARHRAVPVSYTHLTLPTKRIV